MVKRRATKLLKGLEKRNYEDRPRILDLTILENKRQRGDLIEIFIHWTDRLDLNPESLFQLAKDRLGLRGHSLKVFKS